MWITIIFIIDNLPIMFGFTKCVKIVKKYNYNFSKMMYSNRSFLLPNSLNPEDVPFFCHVYEAGTQKCWAPLIEKW